MDLKAYENLAACHRNTVISLRDTFDSIGHRGHLDVEDLWVE